MSRSGLHGIMISATLMAAGVASLTAAIAEPRAPKAGNIEFVVGAAAGATPDIFARRVAKVLNEEKIVAQPIVVQNRTGGGWAVATNYMAGRPNNDGLLFGVSPTVFTTPIVQNLPAFIDKITPIALVMRIDLVVAVRPDSPYKDLKDYVAAAKTKERSVQMAGANVGSTDHIVTSLIEKAGGVKLNYVPFDGGGGINSAFLGGSVDSIVLTLDEAEPLIKGNRARPIALLSESRRTEPMFKDVPTAREQGFDIVWGSHYAIAGAPNLDPDVVAWWDDKFRKMVETKAWKDLMQESFLRTDYIGSDKVRDGFGKINDSFRIVLRDVGLSKK
jgi:putative tricarboxylic transport membrane protein